MSENPEAPRRMRADAAEQGLNEHIIRMSFDNVGAHTRPQGAPIQDVEYTVDPEQDRGEFVREKPVGDRRRQLAVAVGCVLLVGIVMGSVWAMMSDSPAASQATKAAPQINTLGMAPGVAQVPASLGGLAEKPPVSLLPQQAPAKEATAPQPGVGVVLPTAATGGVKADATPAAGVKEPEGSQIQTPATPKAAPNTVAQAAGAPEAKPKTEPVPEATPQAAPKASLTTVQQKPESSARPAAKPLNTQAKTETAARQPVKTAAQSASRVDRIESDSNPNHADSVKPLVTYTAAQLNLRSFDAGVMTMVSSKTNQPVRYRVGDALPSGDVIEYLDASSMTVVTNRKVIRITN